ncbi:TIGR00645 family protein [Paracoccus sp. DMF-8]|uniref:TIGR00645 family protein n=1 Tax=Paracoccus sp. DMF-8 TaxID=3019445 RepID=UPI0023E7609C|nr:TIGR00645 family protein [Paracoccus sp. DMF-8]MDF3605081.1 TIGR00645 family protein [Paracoccus sp. DMF-8]
MERLIERSLFASRWLMAPMYLGLVGALAILVWIFVIEIWTFALTIPTMTVNDAILGVLALIDLSLAANLLMIVIFSGYENFVSRLEIADHKDRPEWQGEVDFAGLKLKLVASIVAISGIHLLKVFMDVGKYTPDHIRWMITIHLVFVASGVLLAAMDWIANHGKTLKKPRYAKE